MPVPWCPKMRVRVEKLDIVIRNKSVGVHTGQIFTHVGCGGTGVDY